MACDSRREQYALRRWFLLCCLLVAFSLCRDVRADTATKASLGGVANSMWKQKDTVDATCGLESFYLIDANVMAKRAKVPLCDANKMFRVAPHSGQIFVHGSAEGNRHNASALHFFGTYAAPWFLYESLFESPYHTRDQTRAGLFYVNDYCYYMWWLASAQSEDQSGDSPGDYIIKIYREIIKTPMWRKYGGADFAFFLPWGLAQVHEAEAARPEGGMMQEYLDVVCKHMHAALQITVENMQGSNMCRRSGKPRRSLIAPFVPNVADTHGQALSQALEAMTRPLPGLSQRRTLAFFRGRCSHRVGGAGRLLRQHVAEALADAGEGFDVSCTEKESAGRLPFEQLLAGMEDSVFCLVLPESGQSARLLSETMLAGCIPVFLGPPFAAMPFHEDLNYADFSLTVHLTGQEWLADTGAQAKASHLAFGTTEAELALETVDSLPTEATLKSVAQLADFLKEVPEETKEALLREVKRVRRVFIYHPELNHEDPSATDLLTLNLCRRMNHIANSLPGGTGAPLRRFLAEVAGALGWAGTLAGEGADGESLAAARPRLRHSFR